MINISTPATKTSSQCSLRIVGFCTHKLTAPSHEITFPTPFPDQLLSKTSLNVRAPQSWLSFSILVAFWWALVKSTCNYTNPCFSCAVSSGHELFEREWDKIHLAARNISSLPNQCVINNKYHGWSSITYKKKTSVLEQCDSQYVALVSSQRHIKKPKCLCIYRDIIIKR